MAIRARYRGDGNEHIYAVPMGDVDEDTYQQLDAEQRKALRTTKRGDGELLYDVATDAEMSGQKPAAAKPAEEPAAGPPTRKER